MPPTGNRRWLAIDPAKDTSSEESGAIAYECWPPDHERHLSSGVVLSHIPVYADAPTSRHSTVPTTPFGIHNGEASLARY